MRPRTVSTTVTGASASRRRGASAGSSGGLGPRSRSPVDDRETPVGDLRELGRAVLGDDDAHAGLVREGTEQRDDPLAVRRVEVGERLVDEQQDGALDDGGRDRDERRLARRQPAQPPVEQGTDADGLSHLVDAGRDDDPRDAAQLEGEADLVAHALGGERLARMLQDDPDALRRVAWRNGDAAVADDLERPGDACRRRGA